MNQFLINHIEKRLAVVAAPHHKTVIDYVREAFNRARQRLDPNAEIKVVSGTGKGFVINVYTTTKRSIRFKQILRLRAFMHQYFEIKDFKVAPGLHRGRPVLEYSFSITRIKRKSKDKE